jgi:hypothetical protein
MTRVGITGHQRLGGVSKRRRIRQALEEIISQLEAPLIAVTSLAAGADQLFTQIMISHDAAVDAIIPFQNYERTFATVAARDEYFALLGQAANVTILPRTGDDEECFFEAGKVVVCRSNLLVAVWDGKPARGLGGTADIVRFARDERHVEIKWINPEANAAIETIAARV